MLKFQHFSVPGLAPEQVEVLLRKDFISFDWNIDCGIAWSWYVKYKPGWLKVTKCVSIGNVHRTYWRPFTHNMSTKNKGLIRTFSIVQLPLVTIADWSTKVEFNKKGNEMISVKQRIAYTTLNEEKLVQRVKSSPAIKLTVVKVPSTVNFVYFQIVPKMFSEYFLF